MIVNEVISALQRLVREDPENGLKEVATDDGDQIVYGFTPDTIDFENRGQVEFIHADTEPWEDDDLEDEEDEEDDEDPWV